MTADQDTIGSEVDSSPAPSAKIVSDGRIDITYRPYQAAVAHYHQYIVCGAAVISELWVLTTKKCVQFVDREDIQIVVGASSLMPVLESDTIREVEFIHCHSS